ncbi:MAG: hypothetical protein ACJAWW_001923 [Sulfurimonas sp.]|jgi:hypothetical protein
MRSNCEIVAKDKGGKEGVFYFSIINKTNSYSFDFKQNFAFICALQLQSRIKNILRKDKKRICNDDK